jgi:hypothetical protein
MTDEVQTFTHLLLLLGTTKQRNLKLNEIWEKGGLDVDFIQSAASNKGFSFHFWFKF